MFNQKLIQKFIVYFRKKYGIDVSEEKAEQYLGTIADFYIALVGDG